MKLVGIFIFYCLILFGCKSKKTDNQKLHKNELIDFAQNFKFSKKGDLTFIYILNPETKSKELIFFLDKKTPNLIRINNKKFNTSSIISFSSTFIGLLEKLNELKRVKGVDNLQLIHNSIIKKGITTGKVKELGSAELANIEEILNSKAQLILYSGFGNKFPNEDKLNKLNILSIPIYDWKETHPLGKAEWIKVFGVITNKEKIANDYFNNLKKRYLSIKQKFKAIKLSKPLFSGSLIGDYWYLPAGQSYIANIFKDARIDYVEKSSKGVGSISKSFEYCFKNYQYTYFWINPGNCSKTNLIKQNKRYRFFKAFEKNTFCYSHNPNLFWENSAIEPDSLLLDLIQITHPEINSNRNLYFYKNIK
jgi:iron complex transport system substrate-binding protein